MVRKPNSASNLKRSDSGVILHYRRRRSSSSLRKLKSLSSLRAMERWDDRSGNWAMGSTDADGHSTTSDSNLSVGDSSTNVDLDSAPKLRQSRRLLDKHRNDKRTSSLSVQYAETILLLISIILASYKLLNEFAQFGVVIPAAVVVAFSAVILTFNKTQYGHIYGTSANEYRDNPDPGLAVALLLLPLMALSLLYGSLSSKRDGTTAEWVLKYSFVENPQDQLINSRRSLVGLSIIMSFTTALHILFTNVVRTQSKSGGRRFLNFSSFSILIGTLITIVVKLVKVYSDGDFFNELDSLECFSATVFFQFTLLVISKLAKKGFTMGELVVSSGLGTGLFIEVLNLTRWKIGILSPLKTYRLPTPFLVLQLALIPGSFLIGFLLSPLLVLSRNISQKPLHRLRWPEQKDIHRKILSGSFYILCVVLELSLVGMWLIWVLKWRNPIDLIKEIISNDGRYLRRFGLIGYWLALITISIIGWVMQLRRVRNPIQFKNMHPERVREGREIVGKLVTAANRTAGGMTLNARRKYFHLLVTAIIVPGVIVDPLLTHLGASAAFGVFIFIEYMRYFALYPFSAKIHVFMSEFIDEKDSGAAILSHFYLLTGSMMCLWMENGRIADNLSGVLVLGVGDAMASIVGKKIGKRKWTNLSNKSIEGTIGFAISMMIVRLFESQQLIPILLTSLMEGFSLQNDNLIIGFMFYSICIIF